MSSLLSGVLKMEILMKATYYKVHKIMPRLGRTLFGLWMLVCLWACQTIGPEASQSENQTTKFLQSTSSLKKTERTDVNFQNTVDKVAFFDLPVSSPHFMYQFDLEFQALVAAYLRTGAALCYYTA